MALKITISTDTDTVLDQFLLDDDAPTAARGGGDIALSNAVKSLLVDNWNITEIEDDEAEEA